MELSEFLYEARPKNYRSAVVSYIPTTHEDFWKAANPNVILVAWDAEEAGYYKAMQIIEGTQIRILSQREAYNLDHVEWRNATKFYSFNPQVGVVS